jgi:hypothetical protein
MTGKTLWPIICQSQHRRRRKRLVSLTPCVKVMKLFSFYEPISWRISLKDVSSCASLVPGLASPDVYGHNLLDTL